MKKEFKIGDKVLVEQAIEDDKGNYHDEYATIIWIDEDSGACKLKFDKPFVDEFLDGIEYKKEDLQLA